MTFDDLDVPRADGARYRHALKARDERLSVAAPKAAPIGTPTWRPQDLEPKTRDTQLAQSSTVFRSVIATALPVDNG